MNTRAIRRTLLCLACLAAIAIPVGCGDDGGGGGADTAEDVAQAYADARNQSDAARVCELYTEEIREPIYGVSLLPSSTRPPNQDCETFVGKQMAKPENDSKFAVVSVDEQGDVATAVFSETAGGVTGQLSIPLTRQDGEWKIAGITAYGGY